MSRQTLDILVNSCRMALVVYRAAARLHLGTSMRAGGGSGLLANPAAGSLPAGKTEKRAPVTREPHSYGRTKFSNSVCIFFKSGKLTYIMWPDSNSAKEILVR